MKSNLDWYPLALCLSGDIDQQRALSLAERYKLQITEPCFEPFLELNAKGLQLHIDGQVIRFDLISKKMRYRFTQSKNNEALAKAVKIKGLPRPRVFDCTAGAGIDSTLMAHWDCKVHMVERNNIVAALLEDALERLYRHLPTYQERLSLSFACSQQFLQDTKNQPADIIYLDPMFPKKDGSAMVKKDIRAIQTLVNTEDSGDELLHLALTHANYRVIVKRPIHAQSLNHQKATFSIKMKKHRYDVYECHSF